MFNDRQYKYKVLSIDLSTVRADTAEGLTKKINSLTILTLGGGSLDMKLNSNTNDTISCSDGLKIEGYPITDIYWTNTAQAGLTAKIFIVWID